jgi:DNA-binding transcriptional LysR family regulator
MDLLQNIETFVRVAQTQSFAEAARQFRIARSVVTMRIKQLEEHVGAPLFHRSTRVVRLSEVGQAYLSDCTDLVARAGDIMDQMRDVRGKPAGTLRIHALTGLVLGHFASMLHQFQLLDPVKVGVDCALQIFPAQSTEVVSKPLIPVRRVFCATPQYLEKHGRPTDPRDLHRHKLGLYSGYPTRDRWTFHHQGQQATLYLRAALLTNSVHLLREYALEHAGIVCVPTLIASEALLRGDLEVVMPEQQLTSFQLCAVFAPTSRQEYKLRLLIEHITKAFTDTPPWDRDLIERSLFPANLIQA